MGELETRLGYSRENLFQNNAPFHSLNKEKVQPSP